MRKRVAQQRMMVVLGAMIAVAAATVGSALDQKAAAQATNRPLETALQAERTVQGEIGQALDLYLTRGLPFGFSGTVLVAKDGEIVLHAGYGMADPTTATANTPATRFDIGSIAKQFTAAAILKLEEARQLRTEASISTVLPAVPADKSAITIHHLLTHTSGISSRVSFPGVDLNDRDAMVRHVLAQPLTAEPGAQFVYNNIGYLLLAAIVEIISGQRFEAFCHEKLFRPAQMTETIFVGEQPPSAATPIAVGQVHPGRRAVWPAHRSTFRWGHKGATGVVCSARDLYRWHRALASNAVLNATSRQKFVTPFRQQYAYGWQIDSSVATNPCIKHGGSTIGFQSQLARWPATETVIVVLMNVADRTHFGVLQALQEITHGRTVAILPGVGAVDAHALTRMAGDYEWTAADGSTETLRVTAAPTGLLLAPQGSRISGMIGLDWRQAPDDRTVTALPTASVGEFAWPTRWWASTATATFSDNELRIERSEGASFTLRRIGPH